MDLSIRYRGKVPGRIGREKNFRRGNGFTKECGRSILKSLSYSRAYRPQFPRDLSGKIVDK